MTIVYQAARYCTHRDQIGLIRVCDYFVAKKLVKINYGIQSCRPVRGGSALSTHAEGRAWDAEWWSNAGLQSAIKLMYDNRELLQCQEIIDYRGKRRWASNNTQWISGGWRRYTSSGAPGWTSHFARNWQGALDSRTIDQIIVKPKPAIREPDMILAPTKFQKQGTPALYAIFNQETGKIVLFNGARMQGDYVEGNHRVRKVDVPAPWVGMAATVNEEGRPDGRGVIVASLAGPTQPILWSMQ